MPVSRTIEVILSSQYLERSRRRYSSSNTVLALTLCNTLEWNNDIKEIVTKALKCLYILRVLKRDWIPSSYFLNVYFAFIRWFLEVLCHVVRHLPVYLSDKQEHCISCSPIPTIMSLLMLDALTCALGCGIASVATQNHAFTAYCLPFVLRASLTIFTVKVTKYFIYFTYIYILGIIVTQSQDKIMTL